jgi:hypothetical protein
VFSMPRVISSRRRAHALVLTAAIVAASAIAAPAAAGEPVDPATLNPPAPDVYTCSATGGGTVCVAATSNPFELEPSGIWCGSGADAFEVLDSGGHEVRATRWHDGDGNLTRRLVIHRFPGTRFTNPRTGVTLDYHQHNTDWDVLAAPGDFASATFTGHGVLSMTVPGSGRVLLEAGVTRVGASGDIDFQAGPTDLSDYFDGDASAVDELCKALTGA